MNYVFSEGELKIEGNTQKMRVPFSDNNYTL